MRILHKRLSTLTLALLIFFTSFGIAGLSMVQQVAAASCSDPDLWFSRARWCGYFKDRLDDVGPDVRVGGVPSSVNTVQEFINLIMGDLSSTNTHKRTAAKFVIYTMIGLPAGTTQNPSASQLNTWTTEWQGRMRTYSNISENGTTSTGSNGRIDWFVWQHMPCGTRNTYYQDAHDDVAPYQDDAGNSNCEVASSLDEFIIVRNTSGSAIYTIRRACMNPMGSIGGLSTNPSPNFNLNPAVGATITDPGGGTVSGNVAQVGDTVRFTFTVRNTGSTASSGTITCTIFGNARSGYSPPASPPTYSSSGGYTPPPISNCPPSGGFAINATVTVATQDVVVSSANQTICRTLRVSPATFNGGPAGAETCIYVANKPYLKVYGGDITTGSALETAPDTCTNNANAGIVSWNRRATGGYAGAGVQYAAYALSTITDFATALGNSAGAPTPIGLSFASTTSNAANGNFGGTFGAVTCIPDYYSRKPSGASAIPGNVSAMTGGAYEATGTTTLEGGNVNPGENIAVYIDGDVFINSNITYTPNWSYNNTPLFQLVVRGNIYVSNAVTRLDGVYSAQAGNAGGGTIYTCATTTTPITLTNGAFFNTCNSRLAVNGAFTGNRIEFLRTAGTLSQSSAGESSGGSAAGEIFNFNPTLWMIQPPEQEGTGDNYDAIISLPPVL